MAIIRCRKCKEDNCNKCNIYILAEMLENRSIKSVSNVVEVVRCKDCKYAILEENLKICNHPSNNAWNITETHYCGYGKRREDE